MKDAWNPAQYGRFASERNQPFQELVNLIERRSDMQAVDLGCGTGELTLRLHQELGLARTLGIDRSQAMLARSHEFRAPGLSFEQGDLGSLTGRYDLIFSHAALQWLDDHPGLFAHLTGCLNPGGQLAVQVPSNFDHPAHLAASVLAQEEPFRTALDGYCRPLLVLSPAEYSCLLWRLGFVRQHVRLQVFLHVLESREGVLEWVKGTLLTDYERRLSPALFVQFLARYAEKLSDCLEDERPFLYPFKRVLIWAAQA